MAYRQGLDDGVPIGALARRTGTKVQTIRYYEQIGLLEPSARTEGNQRRYRRREADRLAFIRHARELGFPLDTIRDLLDLTGSPGRSCAAVDTLAARHLAGVRSRLTRLQALERELERMLGECAHQRIADCRVIEVLADHRHCLGDHGKPDES